LSALLFPSLPAPSATPPATLRVAEGVAGAGAGERIDLILWTIKINKSR